VDAVARTSVFAEVQMVDGIRIRHRDVKIIAPVIGPDEAQSFTDAPRKRDKHCRGAAPNLRRPSRAIGKLPLVGGSSWPTSPDPPPTSNGSSVARSGPSVRRDAAA
jgi:hypothetical protein